MKITVVFDVEPNKSDPAEVAEVFQHYLCEMLDVGYIDDADMFTIMDCNVERALFQV